MKKCSLLMLLKIMGLEPLFNFVPFPNFKNKKYHKCKIFGQGKSLFSKNLMRNLHKLYAKR